MNTMRKTAILTRPSRIYVDRVAGRYRDYRVAGGVVVAGPEERAARWPSARFAGAISISFNVGIALYAGDFRDNGGAVGLQRHR